MFLVGLVTGMLAGVVAGVVLGASLAAAGQADECEECAYANGEMRRHAQVVMAQLMEIESRD